MSYKLVQHLGIKHYEINIQRAVEAITESIAFLPEMTEQAQVNLPARVRMATLYAVSQSINERVANTCNLSEDWVGYATRYGDGAGDFSLLCNLTVTEVKEIFAEALDKGVEHYRKIELGMYGLQREIQASET